MIEAENTAAQGGEGSGAALYRLIEAGKVKVLPVGTRVRVVKGSMFSRKVLVLDGEEQGTEGWIQVEEVLPPASSPPKAATKPVVEEPPLTEQEKTAKRAFEERQRTIELRNERRAARRKNQPF